MPEGLLKADKEGLDPKLLLKVMSFLPDSATAEDAELSIDQFLSLLVQYAFYKDNPKLLTVKVRTVSPQGAAVSQTRAQSAMPCLNETSASPQIRSLPNSLSPKSALSQIRSKPFAC